MDMHRRVDIVRDHIQYCNWRTRKEKRRGY
jgi:hypothetical protein